MSSRRSNPYPQPLKDKNKYKIGIVCAKGEEMNAVIASLDHWFSHPKEWPETESGDDHSYTYGTIARHHVVISGTGGKGNVRAKDAAKDMRRTFENIKLCLVVGICGIVPQIGTEDAVLGDVIMCNAVIEYTEGKIYPTGFEPENMLAKTSNTALISSFEQLGNPWHQQALRAQAHENLNELITEKSIRALKYKFPGRENDFLYEADYTHTHRDQACTKCCARRLCESAVKSSCEDLGCSHEHLVTTRPRLSNITQVEHTAYPSADQSHTSNYQGPIDLNLDSTYLPEIFIGTIASGNVVLKDGIKREMLARNYGVVGIEMEGAGVSDTFPTVVIKAGCDYADSHKNKRWQAWAAMTAASCAKAYLQRAQMGIKPTIPEAAEHIDVHLSTHASSGPPHHGFTLYCAGQTCRNTIAKEDRVAWDMETNELICKECFTEKYPHGHHSVLLKLGREDTQRKCRSCVLINPFDGLVETRQNRSASKLHFCCSCIGNPDKMEYIKMVLRRDLRGKHGQWEYIGSPDTLQSAWPLQVPDWQ